MDMMLIDLHTHSDASDGTDSPAELLAAAAAAGVDVVALTDHDTTGGWAAAEAALPSGVSLIRGAEFSTVYRTSEGWPASVHLLGYLFDPDNPAIVAENMRLRAERLSRGLAIVDRMAADGVPISRQQVLDMAAGAPVGRPHIGRALVASGLVSSVTEAFSAFLAGNSKYYVAKADTAVRTAIEMITAAGGVSVVAHGRSRSAARVLTRARFAELADLGLNGIEVDHPDHDAAGRSELNLIARNLGLIRTGSSDYHGTNKTLRIGQGTTDPDQLERLVAASSGLVRVLGPAGAAV
jgi:predicted metal-dependent phosphoesterase TrpH